MRSLVVESSSNADASDDIDIAVGGIVGGVIVLFLVAGLIAVAVVVHRAKRNRNDVMGTTSAIVRQASFQTKEGNHGRIDLPTNNHYGSRLVERPVNHNHYDVLKPSEVGNG